MSEYNGNEFNGTNQNNQNGGNEYQYSYVPGPAPAKKKKSKGFFKVLSVIMVSALVLLGVYLGGKELYVRYFESGKIMPTRGAATVTDDENNVFDKLFGEKDDDEEEDGKTQSKGDNEKKDNRFTYGERENSTVGKVVNTGKEMTAAQVYAANVNATVGITVGITTNYWGYTSTSAASGSGFIVTENGYILTNYHVIEDANSVTIKTFDGSSYDAVIVGCDESNDIAVLKIEAEGLQTVIVGDSDNMNVGDTVLAIGNPLGELTFSLTQGIVSALGREVTLSGGVTMDLIQTDCAINSGNSGGALFNLYGEVIGITNAKYSSSGFSGSASIDNIGFAIPMNNVVSIVSDIIEKGYATKPYIGISVQTVDETMLAYGVHAGAAVAEVVEGSPAEKSGLVKNDIITAVDGKEITSSSELVEIISKHSPGDVVVLSIYRQGKTGEIKVTIGEKQSSSTSEETQPEQEEQLPFEYNFIPGQGEGNGQIWGGFPG